MSSIVYVNTTEVTVDVLTATTVTVDVTYSSTEVLISNLQGPQGDAGVASGTFPIYVDDPTNTVAIYATSEDVATYVVQRDANQRFSIGAIDWDMNSTQDTAEARLYWNGNESLNLGLGGGNVTISLGQEVINYVTNAEATTLNVGEVVYLFGAQGDRPSVKRASNTSDTTSSKTFGIVAETITAGGAGFVVNKGICGKINTAAYNEGDVLWLSSTPGQFTKTKPVAPEHLVFVGVVLRTNAGNGLVYVAPQNGYELDEIHDVLITSATNGDFLVYESSTDLWKNKQITATDPVNYDAATQVISIDDASTSAKGAVQLTSLTNSTSEVLAATAKGLKDAYDVAAGAIPKSIIDNEGDLIVGASDDNPGKLGVGSNGYVLTVDTTVAGKIAWKAASGGAVNVTSPITNSGTSTNPIIGIDDASTTQKGAVQLSSSTDSTSEVLAATPLAVKTAYDQGSQGISDAATVASNLATHEADTTNVHGISDTANLVYTNNAGLVASATAPVTYSSNTIAINDATTAQKGAVQLSSLTNSTSEILAATPKAVKDAYDLANTANTTANAAVPQTRTISTTSPLAGGGALSGDLTLSVGAASTTTSGVVQLVNSTNSTSVTTAATPNSVKLAYDLAAAAAPATRTISTTAPLTGGGDLSANRTFAINSATTSAAGAVQLNATVTSTSQTLAATASAVKTAYDFADEIQTRVIMEAI